ncbi:MAG: bacteriocin [Solobacterium sp.]|nr:bacteriocin [Solobacterium sp.]MDY4640829.1 bacteriocin [Erysipelotrichaceae bacterium]
MEKINNEELNEVSGGRGLNSLEYKLLEKLKMINQGRYKMGEISLKEYTKMQDSFRWYERYMENNDNKDVCYFDPNVDWKARYDQVKK